MDEEYEEALDLEGDYEMNEWHIKETDRRHKMLIICPVCAEWYEIPRSLEEIKCYRYCPMCGAPMFVGEKTKKFFKMGEQNEKE